MPRETVRKGVRATLRAWIWQVYGGQTGPKSTVSVARKATLQAPPRLFGQFHKVCFPETRIPSVLMPTPSRPGRSCFSLHRMGMMVMIQGLRGQSFMDFMGDVFFRFWSRARLETTTLLSGLFVLSSGPIA